MKVGTTEVNSKQEYLAGLRDEHRIEMLKLRGDLTNPRVASAMYRRLKSQPFYFETEVGKNFVRELGNSLRPSERGYHTCGIQGTGIIRKNHQEEEYVKQPDQTGRKTQTGNQRNTGKHLVTRELSNRITAQQNTEDEPSRNPSQNKTLRHCLIGLGIISALILAYCITSEVTYQVQSHQSAKKMSELQGSVLRPLVTVSEKGAQILDRIAMSDNKGGILHTTNEHDLSMTGSQSGTIEELSFEDKYEAVSEHGPEENSMPEVLSEYKELYQRNQDMIGWIKITDTEINYPVMQTKEDMEYYLQRGFDREDDLNGLPFLDARCDINQPTVNLLIYGHCMKNGSMFAGLLQYKKQEFWEEHPIIQFDTIYEKADYEIIAVYQTRVANVEEKVFRYYNFIDTENEQEMNEYIDTAKSKAYYETGKTAEFGDKLLTLSTCDKEITDGRLVVVAKKCTK